MIPVHAILVSGGQAWRTTKADRPEAVSRHVPEIEAARIDKRRALRAYSVVPARSVGFRLVAGFGRAL